MWEEIHQNLAASLKRLTKLMEVYVLPLWLTLFISGILYLITQLQTYTFHVIKSSVKVYVYSTLIWILSFTRDSGVLRDHDSNFSVGPGFHIAHRWAKERAGFVGSNQIDMLEIFTLPVGVKSSSEMFSNGVVYSDSTLPDAPSNLSTDSFHTVDSPSRVASPNTGLEAITEIYNTAFTLLKGGHVDEPRKRGLLSERAASMLVSFKLWQIGRNNI